MKCYCALIDDDNAATVNGIDGNNDEDCDNEYDVDGDNEIMTIKMI